MQDSINLNLRARIFGMQVPQPAKERNNKFEYKIILNNMFKTYLIVFWSLHKEWRVPELDLERAMYQMVLWVSKSIGEFHSNSENKL